MRNSLARSGLPLLVFAALAAISCGSKNNDGFGGSGGGGGTGADGGPGDPSDPSNPSNPGLGTGGEAGVSAPGSNRDPISCDEAAKAGAYMGCDFWPTVTANIVDQVFDFAVVVANLGQTAADVKVTQGASGATLASGSVAPGALQKFYLPWVAELKGPGIDATAIDMKNSVVKKAGAFHLTTTAPVVVYQFNALEYRAKGGKPGKDWSSCQPAAGAKDCYSYSNDASLLLPSTALTGNYRIFGQKGWTAPVFDAYGMPTGQSTPTLGTYIAITATQDGTDVTVKLPKTGAILGSTGGEIAATAGGGSVTFKLNAGDVAELTTAKGHDFDLSGGLVSATKPVQVISGLPCVYAPEDKQACDHIEESVFPAETMGQHYVVSVPTGPNGNAVGHIVRFYGNVDGTTLKYGGTKPAACPTALTAGQVVDCGLVSNDFEVSGDHEFGVGSYMLGGELLDPTNNSPPLTGWPQGDPSQSFLVPVEQYRTNYLFLAPDDYTTSYLDIVGAADTKVTLDGAPLSVPFKQIGGSSEAIARVKLGAGNGGSHKLESDKPVGIQVMGYGDNTSYQYPGGCNLGQIAPPPIK